MSHLIGGLKPTPLGSIPIQSKLAIIVSSGTEPPATCAILSDPNPPGPPGFTNSKPTFFVVLEARAGNLTMPRSMCSPYGLSQSIGTENFAHWRLGGRLASGGHEDQVMEEDVLFFGGKQSSSWCPVGIADVDAINEAIRIWDARGGNE